MLLLRCVSVCVCVCVHTLVPADAPFAFPSAALQVLAGHCFEGAEGIKGRDIALLRRGCCRVVIYQFREGP